MTPLLRNSLIAAGILLIVVLGLAGIHHVMERHEHSGRHDDSRGCCHKEQMWKGCHHHKKHRHHGRGKEEKEGREWKKQGDRDDCDRGGCDQEDSDKGDRDKGEKGDRDRGDRDQAWGGHQKDASMCEEKGRGKIPDWRRPDDGDDDGGPRHHGPWGDLSAPDQAKLRSAMLKIQDDPKLLAAKKSLGDAMKSLAQVRSDLLLGADPSLKPLLEKAQPPPPPPAGNPPPGPAGQKAP